MLQINVRKSRGLSEKHKIWQKKEARLYKRILSMVDITLVVICQKCVRDNAVWQLTRYRGQQNCQNKALRTFFSFQGKNFLEVIWNLPRAIPLFVAIVNILLSQTLGCTYSHRCSEREMWRSALIFSRNTPMEIMRQLYVTRHLKIGLLEVSRPKYSCKSQNMMLVRRYSNVLVSELCLFCFDFSKFFCHEFLYSSENICYLDGKICLNFFFSTLVTQSNDNNF